MSTTASTTSLGVGYDRTPIDHYITQSQLDAIVPTQYPKLDRTLGGLDRVIDPADWIPILSTVMGAMQVVLGLFIILGSLLAGLYEGAKGFCTDVLVDYTKNFRQAKYDLGYAGVGLLHICRGFISMIPILGNAALIIYDKRK